MFLRSAVLLGLVCVPAPEAATYTWTGTASTSWGTTTNWSPNGTPGSGDDIVVDKAGGATIALNGDRSVRNITFGNSSSNAMTIQQGSSGSLTIASGGAISSAAGSTGAHVISCPLVLSSDITATLSNASGSLTVSGALSGGYGVTKVGSGTLNLSGANTYTGPTYSNLGTLSLSGSHTWSGAVNDLLDVNTVGAQNAILKITGGTHGFYYSRVGRATNSIGAAYQSAGALTINGSASGVDEFSVGYGSGAYGYYKLSGGTITTGEVNIGGTWGGDGIMDVTGGTLTDNWFLIVGRGAASSGLLNITGGAVTAAGATSLNWATTAGDFSVVNVGGGGSAATLTGSGTVSQGSNPTSGRGISLTGTSTSGTSGFLNLLSNGTLTVSEVTAYSATPTSVLNFNGGTLKATSTNTGASFLTSSNISNVYIHSGGAILDDNGTAITISRPLLTNAGTGVTGVTVTSAGSGYIGAPLVKITGGTGTPATAHANMVDDGTGNGTYKVGSITVTTPGVYTVAPTTVTLAGGGPTSAATASLSTGSNTSGGLTKNGSGAVTLSGANTYTGATTINAGTLSIANSIVSPTYSIASGAVLELVAPVDYTVPTDMTFTGAGTLRKSGAGLVRWDGAVANFGLSAGGLIDVQAGTLKGGSFANDVWTNNYGSLNVASGAAFHGVEANVRVDALTGAGSIQSGYSGSGYTNMTFGVGNGSGDFTGVLANQDGSYTANFVKAGTGTQTLSGANTFTGTMTVSGGTLKLNNTAALGTTAAGTSVGSGAALDLNGVNSSSSEALTLNGTGIAGAGALLNSSATGATYGGLITLGSASSIIGGTGTINVSNTGTITGAGYGLTLGGASGGTLASIIGTGTGTVTKQDAGTWTLSGANTYSGGTTINAGKIVVTNSASLGSGTVVLNGGTLANNATVTLANPIQAQASSSSTIDVNSGGNLTLSGGLSGSGTITRGTSANLSLFLSGDNSGFSGTYQDQNDSNSITRWSASTAGSANARWIFNQAKYNIRTSLDFGTGTIQFGSMSGNGYLTSNAAGTKTIQAGALGLDDNYSGTLGENSGALALIKVGTGTFTLGGANTYTGATTVSAGTLKLGHASALGTNAAGTSVTSGAVLDLNGVNYSTAEALTLNGTGISSGGALINSSATGATYAGLITLGSASSIVGGTGTINVSNAGTITGAGLGLTLGGAQGGTLASILGTGTGTLTKQGAGTWTLSGTNTFSGATTVSAGTLLVNGANASSAVTVASGAILGGTGTVAAVTDNGTIRPGSAASKGIFTAASANLSAGSLSLRAAAFTTAGTDYDRFKTTGALTLGGTSVLNLDLSGLSGTGTLTGVIQAGSITGTFATVNINNYAGSSSVELVYNSTSIDIVVGSGTTFGWTGNAGTTDWGTAANWSPIGVPGADASVTINKAGGATVALNGNRTALLLTLGNPSGSDAMILQPGSGGTLTIASGGALMSPAGSTGSHVISCPVALSSNLGASLFGTGETVDIQGVLSGAYNLTKSGAGTLKLSGTNTYSGATNVNGGFLQLGSVGALGSTTGVAVASGAALDLAGQNHATSIPLTLNGTGVSSGGALMNSSATGATYAGLITLGGASSIVGGTGTINVSNAGTITGAGYGLTLGGASGGTLASILGTGAGTLTKLDAGTWTLSGANTFSGATTVSAGTLLVNGTNANSTVTVNSGAILGGTGSVGGIVGNSGTVRPGSSGSKGILGGTTANFSGGTNSKLGIRAAAFTTAGTDFDRLDLSGALTLGGTSELDLDLTGIASAGTVTGVARASSITGTFASVVPSNYSGTLGFNVVYTATSIDLVFNNQAPSFTKGANQTVSENAAAQTVAGWATALDKGSTYESGQTVSFTTTNDNNGLFSVQPALSSAGTLTYTPAASANGTATVTVRMHDNGGTANGGVDSSAAQTFTITVSALNDAPSYTSGSNVTVLEDAGAYSAAWATSLSKGPTNENGQTLTFTVTNNANALFSAQPAIASDGTLTFTPAADANGTATVTVRLKDDGGTAGGGVDSVAARTFTITMTAVNDAPSYTSGSNVTVAENSAAYSAAWATSIGAGPADESGQTLTFTVTNDNNALFSVQPALAPDGTLTFTPTAIVNGVATVTVRFKDNGGTANSAVDSVATRTFTITVSAVNDAPSFTKGADQTANEDIGVQSVAGWATSLSAGPADEAGQTLTFAVTNNNNALFSAQPAIAPNGTLTYTPAANANGSATVSVRLHDNGGTAGGGVDSSALQTFTITVSAINDAPSFTKGVDQVILQNAGAQSIPNWATSISAGPADESGQSLGFRVTNDDNAAFDVQPAISSTGTLTYTATAAFAGTVHVQVRLGDNAGTANGGVDSSAVASFVISVGAVNQAPTFTKGADQTVSEDPGAQTIAGWATGISEGVPSESWQTLTFVATNDNNTLFSVQPAIAADGTLTFTPAANANGSAAVSVRLHDNGGTVSGGVDTSSLETFAITVSAVNDAPGFTKGGDQNVAENAGAQTVAGWATSISAGPADESGQTLSFAVTNDNNALFSAQPAIASNGTLTYTPAASANGTATVSVRLHDNGGTAGGGVDSSAVQSFTITVAAINDAPSYTKGGNQTVSEDAGPQTVVAWATAISAGPANEAGQTLTFTVANDTNAFFSVQPAIAVNGTLTYTVAPDAYGTANVAVWLRDNGGTANGGVDSTPLQTFTITANSVNDAPSFVAGADRTVGENAGAQTVVGWATSINPGPSNESSQTLSFAATNDNNALFSVQPAITANGTLTFTPAANASGSATVSVRLHDDGGTANGGVDSVAARTFTITVNAINDAPSYTSGSNVTVLEDAGAYSAGWATSLSKGPANENGQTLTFTVTNDANALFSAQPAIASDGTLTFTPAADANGTATVTVRLKDDGGTAGGGVDSVAARTFTITVNAINDAPSYTSGLNVTVSENAGAYSASWATSLSAGPSDELGQALTFTVTNNNNSLFSIQPSIVSDGTLTFTPAASANGTATVTVRLKDDGGTANGGVDSVAARTFTITVNAINDAPSYTSGSNVTVSENAGAYSAAWATSLSAGPSDESGQALTFTVTNNNSSLFSTQPSIGSDGTLTFVPAASANGTATVTVRLKDDGGTANGGVDSVAARTFTITVNALNDAPSYTSGSNVTVWEDAGAYNAAWATSLSKGPLDESGQTLTFTVTNNANALFDVQPAIASDGALTFTPAANATGMATVTVRLKDDGGTAGGGVDSVAARTFTITVNAINDAPSYTSGSNVTVSENAGAYSATWATSLSAGPSDESGQALTFTATTNNNSLFGTQPSIGSDGTLTFVPAASANGTATVTVRLKDDGGTAGGGVDSVAARTFTITVSAVNDAPGFAKGADQAVDEDAGAQSVANWATSLSAGPADEVGQTLTFAVTNNNNALFGVQPSIASNGTLTYTPAANANGTATVSVRLHDNGGTAGGGVDTSALQTFTITVAAINDAPSFTKGIDQTVAENAGAQSVGGWASAIGAGPANESGQTLTFAVTNSNNALFSVQPSIAANGTLTYTPAANTNGSATVTVRLHDNGGTTGGGVDTSALQTFTITVSSINDAPSFTKGADQTVDEDAGAQSVSNWATSLSAGPADEVGQTLTFAVTNNNNTLFGVQPAIAANGTLTYTPAANANGTATVSVRLHDNGGTAGGGVDASALQTFTITVTAINDAPSFTKGADQTVAENAGAQSVAGWASAISAGPTNESGQAVTFAVSNSNNALFSVQPAIAANGTLTFTPATNTNGSATVTVRLHDNGGTAAGGVDTSAQQTFTITVNVVNDAPSFTKGADQTVSEDIGSQTLAGWATSISAGPADEAGQTLTFAVSNNNNTLFSVQPSIASNGTLAYAPAANANGTATVSVRLHDNGGTAGGGVDTSALQTFTITVTAINDAPSFAKGADQTVAEDAGMQTVAGWATAISAGPSNESSQTLTFVVTNDNNALFSAQPAIASNGTLTYTPVANAHGTATVSVRLHDDGGTASGGVDTSALQTFAITVNTVNDAPSFAKGADQVAVENTGAQTVTGWASAISAGPADEAGQVLAFSTVNDNNTLFSAQPAIALDGTLTYTPATSANGTATVSVRLRDNGGTANGGVDSSAWQTFTISVAGLNGAPSFAKGADLSIDEDAGPQTVAGWATSILPGPARDSSQALTFVATNDNNALFATQPAIASNGTLTFTPAADANGAATVSVRLRDNGGTAHGGVDSSALQTFAITVNAMNDAPSFAKGANQAVNEDVGAQTIPNWASAIAAGPSNESSQTLTFVATNDNNALFSAQPAIASNGTLTFTPAADGNGAATVSVRLRDNGGTIRGGVDSSAVQTFTITVNAVNQAPSFTKGANQAVNEDAGAQTVVGWASAIAAGPANESSQTLTFVATNDNNAFFTVQPAIASNGTLTFTPALDANGVATVSVRLRDDGGTAHGGVDSSAVQTFTITVNAVNDAPNFVKGANQSIGEDAGTQTAGGWATAISAGPVNESSQTLTFVATNDNSALFSVQPAIASNGTLTYAAAANANGTATVSVRLRDNGGTAGGGVDSSAVQTFTITVVAVNDAPSFAKGADQTAGENAAVQTVAGWASAVSAGPSDEASQVLTFSVTNDNPSLFRTPPAIAANGTLTWVPAPSANGKATVSVRLRDDGGTANGGLDSSAIQTFTITVVPVNDAPSFVKGANPSVPEDAGAQTIAGWASGISAGPSDEAGQTLVFAATNDNNALFAVQPSIASNGTLTFTPAPNADGLATVSVRLRDNGGTAGGGVDTSAWQSFTITVRAVNDAPSFAKGADQAVDENAGPQTVAGWAKSISSGPSDEAGQNLTFEVANDKVSLFGVQPAIAANGTLTYAPAKDASGTALVRVRLRDNGGVLDGGVDTSAVDTFRITVRPIFHVRLVPDTLRIRPKDSAHFTVVLRRQGSKDSVVSSTGTWSWDRSLGRLDSGRIQEALAGVAKVRFAGHGGTDSAWLVVASFDSALTPGKDSVSVRVSQGVWAKLPPRSISQQIAIDPVDTVPAAGFSDATTSLRVKVQPVDTTSIPLKIASSKLDPARVAALGEVQVYAIDSTGAVRRVPSVRSDSAYSFAAHSGYRYTVGWDTLPTVVSAVPVVDSVRTDSASLRYSLRDNTVDASAFLCLLRAGETAPRCSLLAQGNRSETVASVPRSALPLGARAWIEGRDARSTVGSDSSDIVVRLDTLRAGKAREEDRYELLAMPYIAGKGTVVEAFKKMFGEPDPRRWRVYRSDSTAFAEVGKTDSSEASGAAYWVRTRRMPLEPWISQVWTTPVSKPVAVELAPGWNMLGNPYPFDVSWNRVRQASGLDSTALRGPYAFDPVLKSWSLPDTTRRLAAWRGVAVFNATGRRATLRLPPVSAAFDAAARSAIRANPFRAGIRAWQAADDTGRVWVGVDSSASSGLDGFDNPRPPSPATGVSLFLPAPAGPIGARQFLTDVRPLTDTGAEWTLRVEGLQPRQPLRLAMARGGLDSSAPLWILDRKSGRWLEASESMEFAMGDETSRDFTVLAGISPSRRLDLTRFGVWGRPRGLAWAIPESMGRTRVKIDLYDLRGRRLQAFVDEDMDPGSYARELRQTSAFARTIVVLQAGGQRQTLGIAQPR